jgi:hypothetical protein
MSGIAGVSTNSISGQCPTHFYERSRRKCHRHWSQQQAFFKRTEENKWKDEWKQCCNTVVAAPMAPSKPHSVPMRLITVSLVPTFSLPTIPTLYCHSCAFALLSAYYLLVRLCISLRSPSDVTISTAQYLPIYLYARGCVNSYVPMRAIYPYV